jgi:hypothetical protein
VDTEKPEDGGMVRDTDTSWLCTDSKACSARAFSRWDKEPGYGLDQTLSKAKDILEPDSRK